MVAGGALSTEYSSYRISPIPRTPWACSFGERVPSSWEGPGLDQVLDWPQVIVFPRDDGCFWKLPRALSQGPIHPLPYSHPTLQSLFSQMEALSAVVNRADGVQGTFSILGIEFGPWIY